ncbi:hypothetical protein V8B55DRAFT_1369212 [Mucor lusitanicus]|uniref:Uncharacterized protein n=1 Tax=Mucor lusitanicus CBS 277.49 TaxID=747725 RepID=A0A168HLF0_MUCCL|nr:hypothetical protein MUCCIDRAFT_115170 [Mucor lusitanicus CBS 277.49]
MAFTSEFWANLSCEAQKWTTQAAQDVESFLIKAIFGTSNYCNEVNSDSQKFAKQAAQKSQDIGEQIAYAIQELGQELHKRFAGPDNLSRLLRCDQLNEEVQGLKINHQQYLGQLDAELRGCLNDLEHFEQAIKINPSSYGTSLDNLSRSLERLKTINQDLSNQINRCRKRVMQEKPSMSPGSIFRGMELNAMNLPAAFGTISAVTAAIAIIYLVAQFFYRTYLAAKASDRLKQLEEDLSDIEAKSTYTFQALDKICGLACGQVVLYSSDVNGCKSALEDELKNSLEKLSLVATLHEKKDQ